MRSRFDGQVALITGGSSGIGRALARTLAKVGCRVGLIARRRSVLEEVVAEIRDAGGTADWATADVADRPALLESVVNLTDRLGPVDLMIANAGVGLPTTLDPLNIDDVEAMIRVNILGVIYSIESVLPTMLARRSGQIAAISSLAGYQGMPGESAYCASKAAVNAYLDGLRVQLRGSGIATSTICPGFVKTPMTAVNTFNMPFALEADEAARRIVRALERRVKVYNFPWQTALMTRLLGHAPDWIIARVFRDYLEELPALASATVGLDPRTLIPIQTTGKHPPSPSGRGLG